MMYADADVCVEEYGGVSQMWTKMDKGGGGVKNYQISVDVLYGWPLWLLQMEQPREQ